MIYPIILYGTVFVILLDGVTFWLLINLYYQVGETTITPEGVLYHVVTIVVWGIVTAVYLFAVPDKRKEELGGIGKTIEDLLKFSVNIFLFTAIIIALGCAIIL